LNFVSVHKKSGRVGLHFTLPIEFLQLRWVNGESGVGMFLCSNTCHLVKNWTAETALVQHNPSNPPEITGQEYLSKYSNQECQHSSLNKHRTNSVSEPMNKHEVQLLFEHTSRFVSINILYYPRQLQNQVTELY